MQDEITRLSRLAPEYVTALKEQLSVVAMRVDFAALLKERLSAADDVATLREKLSAEAADDVATLREKLSAEAAQAADDVATLQEHVATLSTPECAAAVLWSFGVIQERTALSAPKYVAATQKRLSEAKQAAALMASLREKVSELAAERQRAERPPKIHTKLHRPPGFRLHKFAEFFFSRKTYSNVLGLAIRDLREEYNEALADQRLWKARYVRVRGYYAFWSAVWVHGLGLLVKKFLKALGAATSSPS